MRKPAKITKSEIFLLAATAVFIALALVIHFTDRSGSDRGSYSVRTWRTEEPSGQLTPVDINTADEETLQQLPGIGPALAERIVAERAANGPFADAADLTRVSGIGEKTVQAIAPYITVENGGEEMTADENTGG